MKERIHQPLDHKLVDLGVLASHLEVHVPAAFAREVADHKWHAPEDFAT